MSEEELMAAIPAPTGVASPSGAADAVKSSVPLSLRGSCFSSRCSHPWTGMGVFEQGSQTPHGVGVLVPVHGVRWVGAPVRGFLLSLVALLS